MRACPPCPVLSGDPYFWWYHMIRQVFPASHFEDFLVHHRTNNKNGRRGESIPAVPVSMLRVWAEQFLRDERFLEVHSRRHLLRAGGRGVLR